MIQYYARSDLQIGLIVCEDQHEVSCVVRESCHPGGDEANRAIS